MNKTIGFIGSGNMGGAMIGGIIKAGLTAKENIYVSDINEESLARVRESYGVNTTTDNAQLAKVCDIIVLSVKPFLYPVVINQIKAVVKEDVIIVVIAAGQSSEAVAQLFGRESKSSRQCQTHRHLLVRVWLPLHLQRMSQRKKPQRLRLSSTASVRVKLYQST